jgi:hypothetical protein
MERISEEQLSYAISTFCNCLDVLYVDWMTKTEGSEACFDELKDTVKFIADSSLKKSHAVYKEQIEELKKNKN